MHNAFHFLTVCAGFNNTFISVDNNNYILLPCAPAARINRKTSISQPHSGDIGLQLQIRQTQKVPRALRAIYGIVVDR